MTSTCNIMWTKRHLDVLRCSSNWSVSRHPYTFITHFVIFSLAAVSCASSDPSARSPPSRRPPIQKTHTHGCTEWTYSTGSNFELQSEMLQPQYRTRAKMANQQLIVDSASEADRAASFQKTSTFCKHARLIPTTTADST